VSLRESTCTRPALDVNPNTSAPARLSRSPTMCRADSAPTTDALMPSMSANNGSSGRKLANNSNMQPMETAGTATSRATNGARGDATTAVAKRAMPATRPVAANSVSSEPVRALQMMTLSPATPCSAGARQRANRLAARPSATTTRSGTPLSLGLSVTGALATTKPRSDANLPPSAWRRGGFGLGWIRQ